MRRLGVDVTRYRTSPYEYLLNRPRYQETIVSLQGHRFRVADAASFYWSHREIFIDEIYRFPARNDRPVILDCGSNYGTSIVYFKSLYPGAQVTGIEADPDVFALLQDNLSVRGLDDVVLHDRALSATNAPVTFRREGADSGHVVHGTDGSTDPRLVVVDSMTLDELIVGPVDFLKMDIEGAETDVLASSRRLADVDRLFVEYHSFEDQPQTLGRLLELLNDQGFRVYAHTQYCSSRPLVESESRSGMDLQLNLFAKRH